MRNFARVLVSLASSTAAAVTPVAAIAATKAAELVKTLEQDEAGLQDICERIGHVEIVVDTRCPAMCRSLLPDYVEAQKFRAHGRGTSSNRLECGLLSHRRK